jgi:hypothetical protein
MTFFCQLFRVADLLLSQHWTQAPPAAVIFRTKRRLRSQSHPLAVRPTKQLAAQQAFQKAKCCLFFEMQMWVQRWYQALHVDIVACRFPAPSTASRGPRS